MGHYFTITPFPACDAKDSLRIRTPTPPGRHSSIPRRYQHCAAVLVPAAPGLAIVGIGLVGLLVSKYVAAAIDSFVERRTSASERSTM